jgi:hypothetical protein
VKHWFVVATLVALAACSKKEEPSPTAPSPSAVDSAAPLAAASASAAVTSLPAEEDFEDEAEKEITTANLKDELAKLEKQLP